MPTDQQTKANRRNAQLSTGPRTPAGKAVSSRNALTHGLTTGRTVLPGEDLKHFQSLLADLQREFRPATALHLSLVRQLADTEWRLRRIPDLEAGVLTHRLDAARRWVEECSDKGPEDEDQLEPWLRGEALISDARGSDPLSKLSRYETRLTRNYFKALELLRALQTPRVSPAQRSPQAASSHASRHPSARKPRSRKKKK